MAIKQVKKNSMVQCRIEACTLIDEMVAASKETDEPLSVRKVMMTMAKESGIPFNTLDHWYYKDKESSVKSHVTQDTDKATKTKVARKIIKNIANAIKKEEDEVGAKALRDAATDLADDLGGAILKEELYELFLKAIGKVDEVITASKNLDDPISPDAVVDQLLRQARNAGWVEPVVEEVESNTCDKCVVSSCPNRLCDNYVDKPKKKVKENK